MTYPLLCQFARTLVLAVPQQFNDTTLIGRKAGDFLHDLADERCALGEVAFGAADAGL